MDSTEKLLNGTETIEEAITKATTEAGRLQHYLDTYMPSVLAFLVQLLIAILVLFIGSKLIKWILGIIRKSMDKHATDPSVSTFLCSLIKYALYFVLIMIILNVFGIATASVVAVLGSAGLTAGLALQGSLQNFAGGVLLLILKPFQVGDYIVISAGDVEGLVSEITIYYTKLVTVDNRVIMIPNGSLTSSSIINVSMMNKRRLDLLVGVAYDSNLTLVKEVLQKLVDEDPAVMQNEPKQVFVSELADSSINMGIRVWVKKDDYWDTKWRITEQIKRSFDDNAISIPFPQMDVQIKQ